MPFYEVKVSDGIFCAQFSDGVAPAIRDGNGNAINEFMPGWAPESLYSGVAPVNCLNLRHVNGKRAVWYLDRQFNRIGGSFQEISGKHHAAFGQLANQFETAIWSDIICRVPAREQDLQDLTRLNPLARLDITEYLLNGRLSNNKTVVIQGAAPNELAGAYDAISSLTGRTDVEKHLAGLLTVDLKALLARCLTDGAISMPSPFDGHMQHCSGTLLLTERSIAYRFTDTSTGLPYYILGADWRHGICAVYFPTIRLTVYGNNNQRAAAENSLGGEYHKVMFRHASAQTEYLDKYLAGPQKSICLVYSYWHLGHHLWNELAGLDYILDRTSIDAIPTVYIVDAVRTEMYGKLDQLFPELGGRVDRSLSNWDELRQSVYSANQLCIRINDTIVSRRLASRIVDLANASVTAHDTPRRVEKLANEGYQIVLLGLRVENRTLADLPQFCEDLLEFLRVEMGRVAVVLDGHNSPDGAAGAYISHRENAATQSPISVERELVSHLIKIFSDRPGIKLIDTVGQPMSASIFWSHHCRFFVTPWGAGLAKYRWVCNRPGLVLAGHMFQGREYQQTLHLYDDPAYMESPAPIHFVDRSAVSDAPESPLLIPDPSDATRVNFRVNRNALESSLKEIMRATI